MCLTQKIDLIYMIQDAIMWYENFCHCLLGSFMQLRKGIATANFADHPKGMNRMACSSEQCFQDRPLCFYRKGSGFADFHDTSVVYTHSVLSRITMNFIL